MAETATPLPDAQYIGTLRAGTKIAQLPNGDLVAAHPDEVPMLITPDGLKPLEMSEADATLDCTFIFGTAGQPGVFGGFGG